jgi:solute carrier family 25 protein 34/35
MQPADTALTRMYNQPVQRQSDGRLVGSLYKNPIDCLWKTFKTEGIKVRTPCPDSVPETY